MRFSAVEDGLGSGHEGMLPSILPQPTLELEGLGSISIVRALVTRV